MFTGLVRTVILYVLLIFGIRLMGKHQIGELEPSELVLSLVIADLVAVPMQDFGIPLSTGIIPILTLLSLTMMLSVLTLKNIRLRGLICGEPSIIIQNGHIDQGEMRRNRLTIDELLEELRNQGYTDLTCIQYAILETNGQLSVLPKADRQPLTLYDFGRSATEHGLPVVLVSDGQVLSSNLKKRNLSQKWLDHALTEHGIQSCKTVFLMTIDDTDQIYLVKKEEP